MATSAANAELLQIRVDRIDQNIDNPRVIFRLGELDELLESIRVYGVQVPIAVYREGGRFVLIDGERRWRCALKLNHKTIPALVQQKPGPLENLLLMFNIHALREQWDLLTIALKLPKIIDLLTAELKRAPTERELSEKSGLNRGLIRRCKLLMELPARYKDQILDELQRPKPEQKFTEDLFIELERALKTVERAMPDVIDDKDRVRKVLLAKYKSGVINNRVEFRKVAKIARAANVGFDAEAAAKHLTKLFQSNRYTIDDAFTNSVGAAYIERDIGHRIEALIDLLGELELDEIDQDTRLKLRELQERVAELLASPR